MSEGPQADRACNLGSSMSMYHKLDEGLTAYEKKREKKVFVGCWPLSATGCQFCDSRLAPSQWETSLQSNAVSHWLGANLESALCYGQWGYQRLVLLKLEGSYIDCSSSRNWKIVIRNSSTLETESSHSDECFVFHWRCWGSVIKQTRLQPFYMINRPGGPFTEERNDNNVHGIV